MAINKLSVLEAGFPEDAALMEAGFFENFHRCRVIFVNMGIEIFLLFRCFANAGMSALVQALSLNDFSILKFVPQSHYCGYCYFSPRINML